MVAMLSDQPGLFTSRDNEVAAEITLRTLLWLTGVDYRPIGAEAANSTRARPAGASGQQAAGMSPLHKATSTVALSAFEPAKQFGGAKLGYVFKCGAQGVGYYLDHKGPATKRSVARHGGRQHRAVPGRLRKKLAKERRGKDSS